MSFGLFAAVGAETVHTWVDAQGVRHFSQYPPADPDQPAETLEIEPLPAAPDADDRLQDIRDISRDLERSRQQREEQRARQAPPEPAPAPEPPVVAPTYVLPYPPAYPPAYPPPYPPHRQKPHPRDRPGAEEPDQHRDESKGRFVSPGRAVP